jgi:hypothetical protein
MEEKRKTLSARLARWAAELVLVFVGVYAAFWLNSYQQHQQEANRRDQILASLERILRQGIESGKINWGLSRMAHYQKLSDELIVPNLDQDISFFYDPTTRKLRKRFEMYPEALQATVKFAHDLDRTHTELLKRIQAERHR